MAKTEQFQVLLPLADSDVAEAMGPASFTVYFAERLRREKPGARVAVADNLHLELCDVEGFEQDLRLDNAFKRYLRRPEDLGDIVTLYLRAMLAPPQPWKLQASDENLRPVLRSKDFLQEMVDVLTRGQFDRQFPDKPFGIEALVAYFFKWGILQQWLTYDKDRAQERFEELVAEVTDEWEGLFDGI